MHLGAQEIQYLNALNSVCKINAKDCIQTDQTVSFVIPAGQMGLAIGKNGATVKKLAGILKKNIEYFEYQKNAEGFLKKAFPATAFLGFESQENENGKKSLVLKTDSENKRKVLTDRARFNRLKELVKRHFEFDDIKIGK